MAARKKAKASRKPSSSVPRRSRKPSTTTTARRLEGRRDPAVDEYLARASPRSRALLRDLRKQIHASVPGVEECISYRMPAFRADGRIIAGFSATANGCSYYPFSGRTLRTVAGDTAGYSQTKAALHFDELLPASLVRKLLTTRIAEGPRRSGARA